MTGVAFSPSDGWASYEVKQRRSVGTVKQQRVGTRRVCACPSRGATSGAVQGIVETSASDAGEAIAALREHEAWAIIRRSTRAGDRDTVGLVGGRRQVVESVLDVPLEDGPPNAGHVADRLLAIPFRQVAERGFEAHDDGTTSTGARWT
jgi:hypothetical protein